MKLFIVISICIAVVSAIPTSGGIDTSPRSVNNVKRAASTVPTWPAASDELEDLMFLVSGTNARAFADGVIPCSKPPPGQVNRIASAEWLRTMFHDMSTANFYQAYGGLDASLLFETDREENIGAAFNTTFQFFASFYNVRASASDLLALSTYTATRSCGGPIVPVRTGRIDATEAGPIGVPEPQNAIGTLENQFLRFNFTTVDMIKATACGHTLGGVHSADFPTIVYEDTFPNDYAFLDTTADTFDNVVVTEYLAGTTANPLVVGPAADNGRDSDGRVFKSDGNVTMQALADVDTFASECSLILQRMIEIVPPGVELGDILVPYDVKPSSLQLTLLSNGTLQFTGDIRVRTTKRSSNISSVKILYKDRTGAACNKYVINTVSEGTSAGFDESFEFYSFSTILSANTSISAFNVSITSADGTVEVYDNNAASFPMQDNIMLQVPQSCLTSSNGTNTLNVVAAVRGTSSFTNATLDLSLQIPRIGSVIPALESQSVVMAQSNVVGSYSLYTATYILDSYQSNTTTFDVSVGSDSDSFKNVVNLGSCETI